MGTAASIGLEADVASFIDARVHKVASASSNIPPPTALIESPPMMPIDPTETAGRPSSRLIVSPPMMPIDPAETADRPSSPIHGGQHSYTKSLRENSHTSSIRELALSYHSRRGSSDSSSSSKVLFEGKRRFPMLKLAIQIQDESDWIQVVEDGGDDEGAMSPRNRNHLSKPSYLFTGSGTMLVDGFSPGIGDRGLKNREGADPNYGKRVPMDERLVLLTKLGSGSTSVVYSAFDIQEMQIVAIKKIPVFEKAKRRQMIQELDVMLSLFGRRSTEAKAVRRSHDQQMKEFPTIYEATSGSSDYGEGQHRIPKQTAGGSLQGDSSNILQFYDAFSNLDEGGIALMMEYMDGGSLQDIVDRGGCDNEELLASIAWQILQGLDFLHVNGHIHRDLKPANVLINHKGFVKISDFGIVKHLSLDSKEEVTIEADSYVRLQSIKSMSSRSFSGDQADVIHGMKKTHTFVGTTAYMAPERIDGQSYSYPSDIWSLGLTLITLATGRLPVDTSSGFWSLLHSIRDCLPPVLDNNDKWSEELRDFIGSCLKKDPSARATTSALMTHPFIAKRIQEELNPMEESAHGKEELLQILIQLQKHIETFTSEHENHNSSTVGGKPKSVQSVLALLLLSNSSVVDDFGKQSPSRLAALSSQLSIPEGKCISYVQEFIDNIPKASELIP